jgi:hypothetical protein
MQIEQISPVGIVDNSTNDYSQSAADKSLSTFQANKKSIEDARIVKDAKIEAAKDAQAAKDIRTDEAEAFQEAKEARENAQTAKNAKRDAAEAYQETKETRKAAQKAKFARMDAATLQANRDNLEKTLAAKTDKAEVSRRAAKSAASSAADILANVNSRAETDQAIEAYQANRDAQEVAQAAMAAEPGITGDSQGAGTLSPHIDVMD